LKAETFQRSGSFKARGAFNAALAGVEAGDRSRLLAVSSGNHGQAVALAAQELGLGATVVMPEDSNPAKLLAVAAYGATVVSSGVTARNREEIAADLAGRSGLRMVHPHNDPLVIAGQSTVADEIVEQLAARKVAPSTVVVPVGGGGLLAGVCLALERRLPGVEVVGVEPAAGDDAARSLREGRLVSLEAAPVTAADGARTLHLGSLCWEVIRERVRRIVTVTDGDIAEAVWWLWTRSKLVVEPTGAMSVAALLAAADGRQPPLAQAGSGVVCILSGGNCLPDQIDHLIGARAGG
jgi:threonine dehydratase